MLYSVIYFVATGKIDYIQKGFVDASRLPAELAVKYITAEEYESMKLQIANYQVLDEDIGGGKKAKKLKKTRNVAPISEHIILE